MTPPVRKLLIFLVGLTAFRILYIGWFDLTPDEAYYWTWSLFPDWCYFDQPAGVAVADKIITGIFGTTTWGLRMGAVLLGLVGTLFVFLTAKKLDFSDTEAAWSAALVHLLPLLASGHVLMLHDTVMLSAAIVLIYLLVRAIFENSRACWIGTGIVAAAALYGKFSAVTLALGISGFLLFSKKHRKWFARIDPYLAALTASFLFLPVIAWNVKNEWIAALAVRKLAHSMNLSIADRLVGPFDFLGSQLALVSPIFFVMMIIAAAFAIKKVNEEKFEKEAFVAFLFFGILAWFLLQSIKAKVQGNWAALAYVPGVFLLVRHYHRRVAEQSTGWKKWGRAGFILSVLITLFFIIQPVYPIAPLPKGYDMTDQVHGWSELGKRVDEELEKRPDLILMARRYQVASQLMFYCKKNPEVYVANWSSRGNQFDLWNDWSKLEGRSVLYVDVQGRSGKLWRHFDKAEPLSDFVRKRGKRKIQPVHLTILEKFHMEGPLETYFEAPLTYSATKMRKRLHGEKWGL